MGLSSYKNLTMVVASLVGGATPVFSLEFKEEVPTFFFDLGVGITTYKSKAVESNDTSLTSGYMFGSYAGSNQNLGIALKKDSNKTAFEHPDSDEGSSITTTFERTTIDYRWGVFSVGAALGASSIIIEKRGEDYVDAVGSGFGGHVNLLLPFGKNMHFFLDMNQVSMSTVKETVQFQNDVTTSLGSQSELMLGGKLKLTRKLLDLQVAYKSRSYSLNVGGENYAEAQTMMWIALHLNQYF